ncbi:hypothetical protein RM52_01690 [Microbacterium hominis]|uniref:Uncharacterized protein n=1 Tax=Microbacterium hominis TaxID=162426 RepID=A0A0B4D0F1_9MICO|nr:hypothetical protein RM52_01690 [Microbacterium hominis]
MAAVTVANGSMPAALTLARISRHVAGGGESTQRWDLTRQGDRSLGGGAGVIDIVSGGRRVADLRHVEGSEE